MSDGTLERPNTRQVAAASAPNWDHVPFDVGCARCGYDLRNLSEPQCPQCGLEFDWAIAVPIEELRCLHCGYHLYGLVETRCPECGEPFTWQDVLQDYRRREKPLFEYRWSEKPVRSLLRTWTWALWPPRLWAKMDIHDPPQVLPLVCMVTGALLLFGVSMAVLEGLLDWLQRLNYITSWPGRWGRAPGVAQIPAFVVRALSDAYLRGVFAATLIWLSVSLASLMIFRQSMNRCRVRTVHVMRAWAYAAPLMLPAACVVYYVPAFINAATDGFYVPDVVPLIALFFLCHVTYSLYCAYGTYLRMPHSGAVAIASQLVAFIGAATICFAALPQRYGASFFRDILKFLGLW